MTTKSARQPKGIPVGGQFAATSHAEPDVSLAAPAAKTSPKGRTTTVTLPDGTVATRTSKTMVYTHAVVRSAEVPELVIANRENQIAYSEKIIKDIDDALVNPVFKISRRFNDRDRDPDMSYDGTTPSYHGFEAHLMSADGKTRLYSTHCNSKGLCEGVYDYETKPTTAKPFRRRPRRSGPQWPKGSRTPGKPSPPPRPTSKRSRPERISSAVPVWCAGPPGKTWR
jgi:hypothetical protein